MEAIGHAQHLRCFGVPDVAGEGFVYGSTPKVWMNQCLFFEWLRDFYAFIAQRPDRRVLLLVDNASSHGADGNLPDLICTEVMFYQYELHHV